MGVVPASASAATAVAARFSYRGLGVGSRVKPGGVSSPNQVLRARRLSSSSAGCFFASAASSSSDKSICVDVAVLGGGAAGLTAAYFAAKSGAKVVVYERTKETGKKILMSGGARCNVLPVSARVEDFVTESTPRLMKNVLASWNVERCYAWLVDDVGLALGIEHVSKKYFPLSNSSREVRDKLLQACLAAGVTVRYETSVTSLRRVEDANDPGNPQWGLRVTDAPEEQARMVVMAMGGLSFPAVGTDGTGYAIAKRDLGHVLKEPYPALVPLTGNHPGGERLPGLSVDVQLECANVDAGDASTGAGDNQTTTKKKKPKPKKAKATREGFLFTHRGFSGPSVLDLSHNLVRPLARANASGSQEKDTAIESGSSGNSQNSPSLVVNWSGDTRDVWQTRLTENPGKTLVVTRVRESLPSRLADALLLESEIDASTKIADLRKDHRARLLDVLTKYVIQVDGHQGYRKAEVTGGGVSLDDIDTKSMESKLSPNVFFCGEVCDVFGRIGGFNFLWAWTSGRLAGISAAKKALGRE